MMVVLKDRNMYEQVDVIFNVNFKTLSSLIKSAFVDVFMNFIDMKNARYNDKKHSWILLYIRSFIICGFRRT